MARREKPCYWNLLAQVRLCPIKREAVLSADGVESGWALSLNRESLPSGTFCMCVSGCLLVYMCIQVPLEAGRGHQIPPELGFWESKGQSSARAAGALSC